MNKRFKKPLIVALLALFSLSVLTSCAKSPSQTNTAASPGSLASAVSSISMSDASIEQNDLYADYKNEAATAVALKSGSFSINGSGAKASGNFLTISSSGTYVLTGTMGDGAIIVDAQDGDVVRIVLNNASVTCKTGSPLFVKSAKKVILSMPGGTKNTLCDAVSYTYSYFTSDAFEPRATIFSKDDLVINGTGSLEVVGNFNDGISCNDKLKITGGSLTINAKDDGISVNDMVAIQDANIAITASGDGIKTTNAEEDGKGFIAIASGKYAVTSGTDCLQAATKLFIGGGTFTLKSGGGSAVQSTNGSNWGNWGKGGTGSQSSSVTTDAASAKALKAAIEITIQGGTFDIDSSDDSVHSNKSVLIKGGTFAISSGDDGIHADACISITAGKIVIAKSYEGIESNLIQIDGADVSVTSTDDGANVSGGSDGSSMNGRAGQNSIETSTGGKFIMTGGTLVVNAGGDGLDSNGSIYISGGAITVSGSTANDNSAIDYNGVCEVSGGTLIAAGSSGMAEAPSNGSKLYSIAGALSSVQAAGSTVELADSGGNVIASYVCPKAFEYIVFCCPAIQNAQTYTIKVNGTAVQSVKVSGIVTSFGTVGNGGMRRP